MNLVYVGPLASSLSDSDKKRIAKSLADFCNKNGSPIFCESLSQLTDCEEFKNIQIRASKTLSHIEKYLKLVVRVGGVPTHRIWRNLAEKSLAQVEIVNIDKKKFSGLPSDRSYVRTHLIESWSDFDKVLNQTPEPKSYTQSRLEDTLALDFRLSKDIFQTLNKFPRSEMNFFAELKKLTKSGDWVYLGNSLPVREWDSVPVNQEFGMGLKFEANRGANGIDGQLSSFLGWTSEGTPKASAAAWAVLGDLTTLYNLDAPWILRELKSRRRVLVIVNNGGGQIFSTLPGLQDIPKPTRQKFFELEHQVKFEKWADFWGVEYTKVAYPEDLAEWNKKNVKRETFQVLEIHPDTQESQEFWKTWRSL